MDDFNCIEFQRLDVDTTNALLIKLFKGQLTLIFNLPSIPSTIPAHYVDTTFRTESCFIFNKLTTKIDIKSFDEVGKNQS